MKRYLLSALILSLGMLLSLPFGCAKDGDDDDDNDDNNEDVNDEIPQFISVNYIELNKISKISKFRSGIGHDYSDDFEECRSMKHYFVPSNEVDWAEVKIFSPIDGRIVQFEEGWAGFQVRIESSDVPGLYLILFHVNASNLHVEDMVAAGQQLGTHIGDQTWSDIAVGYDSPEGWKLLSIFELMTDTLFASYEQRGLVSRNDAIISATLRDADPLVCEGEEFQSEGTLENWVNLN